MTSAGLMAFLKEFTIASTKPMMAPPIANAHAVDSAPCELMSPIMYHATAAPSTTRPSVMAVFSTTLSSVMRPGDVGAWRPEDCTPSPEPDRSIFHCDGSAYWVVLRPLNSALFAKTGLLLLMISSGECGPARRRWRGRCHHPIQRLHHRRASRSVLFLREI